MFGWLLLKFLVFHKTELVVVNFLATGCALRSRFLAVLRFWTTVLTGLPDWPFYPQIKFEHQDLFMSFVDE